jgi:hypothetical protein
LWRGEIFQNSWVQRRYLLTIEEKEYFKTINEEDIAKQ